MATRNARLIGMETFSIFWRRYLVFIYNIESVHQALPVPQASKFSLPLTRLLRFAGNQLLHIGHTLLQNLL